jgi:hypothetical protein
LFKHDDIHSNLDYLRHPAPFDITGVASGVCSHKFIRSLTPLYKSGEKYYYYNCILESILESGGKAIVGFDLECKRMLYNRVRDLP